MSAATRKSTVFFGSVPCPALPSARSYIVTISACGREGRGEWLDTHLPKWHTREQCHRGGSSSSGMGLPGSPHRTVKGVALQGEGGGGRGGGGCGRVAASRLRTCEVPWHIVAARGSRNPMAHCPAAGGPPKCRVGKGRYLVPRVFSCPATHPTDFRPDRHDNRGRGEGTGCGAAAVCTHTVVAC